MFTLTENLSVQHWKDGSGTRNFKCRCVLGTQKLSRQKYQVNKPLSITISPLRSTDWQFIPGHFHFAVDHLSPRRLFRPMQPTVPRSHLSPPGALLRWSNRIDGSSQRWSISSARCCYQHPGAAKRRLTEKLMFSCFRHFVPTCCSRLFEKVPLSNQDSLFR